MSFFFIRIKKHFHITCFALSLALKQRIRETRKWPSQSTVTWWQEFLSPIKFQHYASRLLLFVDFLRYEFSNNMTTNDLHMPLQSAYKQNHSTESALLKVKNDILLNMEAQKVTLLVLLDLSATFDTVRHDTLLNRLKSRFDVDGKALEWFASYLADRTQRVIVNDGLSSAFPLRQGVPQGSCSGLFCLRSTPVSCLISSASTSQVYTATQMTHSCIWHSVLMCKGRTRPR